MRDVFHLVFNFVAVFFYFGVLFFHSPICFPNIFLEDIILHACFPNKSCNNLWWSMDRGELHFLMKEYTVLYKMLPGETPGCSGKCSKGQYRALVTVWVRCFQFSPLLVFDKKNWAQTRPQKRFGTLHFTAFPNSDLFQSILCLPCVY